jgi:hypothetical protein
MVNVFWPESSQREKVSGKDVSNDLVNFCAFVDSGCYLIGD